MDAPIRKTRRAFNTPGHAHFLTCSCVDRMPLLDADRARNWMVDAIGVMRVKFDVAVWAYVIMPEHVHVLICPRRGEYEMRRILAQLKRPVSEAARRHLEATGQSRWLERLTVRYPSRTVFRFWQPGGGFDRNIFREHSATEVADYLHRNPVRRGLVERPTDWRWSSARWWAGERDGALLEMDPPCR